MAGWRGRWLATTLVAWSLASAAVAQEKVVEPVSATGSIFQPIVIAKTSDLSFGIVARPHSASGTVIINETSGARTLSGEGQLVNGATPSRARFTITGEGGQAYTVTTPATMNLTRAGGETLTVTLTPTLTTGSLPGGIGATSVQDLGVGGRVTLTPATPIGAYSGSFEVIVAYN